MNLYLLSQTENNDYDTYDSCVVVAENAEEAKNIHPAYEGAWNWTTTWAKSPDNVDAKLIGVAAEGLIGGTVVISSFNAG